MEYGLVKITPYLKPAHPGALNIALGTSNFEATRLREEHNDATLLFRGSGDIENAIREQLVKAIEPVFLKALRNSISNTITENISTILEHLFDNYGVIEDDMHIDCKQSVRAMIYNLTQPIITIFNALKDMQELAKAAGNEYTEK